MARCLPWLALGLATLIGGCQEAPQREAFADLTFAHLGTIALDVAVVDVVRAYDPPMARPHVEHLFPVTPMAAAEHWAHDRLRAAGTTGRAVFTVREASVVESRLPQTGGLRGAFTTEQSERYDAVLSVQLAVEKGGVTRAVTAANVQRARTVPENITLNEREEAWFAMTESLLADMDAQLATGVQTYLADYVR
jgi:hypothetical protein